jgi:heat shock protein HslJ
LFADKGKLSGSTGCNNMSGSYKLKKACLEIEPGAITRMACQGNGETLFLDALKHVEMMKLDGDKLILLDGTKEIMTLLPKK